MASDTAPPPRAPGHGDLGENVGISDGFGGSERDMSSLLQARLGTGIGGLHRSGSAPPNFADDLEGMLGGGMSPLGANWGGGAPAPGGNGGWKQQGQAPPRSPGSIEDRDDALSDPAYVEYYYNQKNLNPRLPPPRTASANANGARDNLWQKSEALPEPHGSQADPWASEPAKGLMGLPTLATRPKSLFSDNKPEQTWQQQDGEYINSSSPVFGHPSSPFAPVPQRPIGTRDDGSLLLERHSRTSRAARSSGLGSFGSAPGTPTKRSMESVTIDSLLHEDLGRRLSVLSREGGGSSLSTSPPGELLDRHGSLNLGEHIKNNSQPVTPTMGGQGTAFDHHIQARNYQDLSSMHPQHDAPSAIRHPHSRSDSPLRKSPIQTPPQMSPPRESSVMSGPQSPEMSRMQQPASAADLLPDSMYGPAAGDMGLGGQPGYGEAMSAAIASSGAEMPQFPTSLSPGPMPPHGIPGFQAAQQQQMQQMQQQMQAQAQAQAQAAATMSMMYGQPGGMQAAQALAQAAALGMGGYPGMGMGLPPFPNPALLMAQAGMYGQGGGLPRSPAAQFPTPPGLPPDYAAYHQRMMEMYATMAQGANPQAGNPSAAMAAAAAIAAANDPGMAAMYAAAAANMPPPPHPHANGGKTSPEPPVDPSSHSNDDRGRPGRAGAGGGKDGSRRGRRGDGRDSGGDDNGHSCPLLEQLKGNKAKKVELQDIVGSVMEFCTDQHGSRFIQLKLETSTGSDTAAVFEEVLPQAISLMTDVFGNYVVQKFFEHGTPEQRLRLADTLDTNILSLSLQMYGCRVVQKALETLSLDRQRAIVAELNGHVMRCVRDQNGNHVIQKCIECVPTGEVAFMIDSFKGQVVMLSAHPYGCRVIQRVLEHCQDKERVRCVMTEVLSSVCQLAQDQYGNYVVQHVLERGAPSDRTTIISELAGQIVEMSQHKFASNVVEKCLQHGSHSDRQILISEIMGRSEENGPLQMMMKDQFGNYVVQKLLEVCDDHQREALLTRIKQHLHNLKKYTYGKHIVARVEKLITNTQRLIRNSSASLSHGAESSVQPEQQPPASAVPVPGPPDAGPAAEAFTA